MNGEGSENPELKAPTKPQQPKSKTLNGVSSLDSKRRVEMSWSGCPVNVRVSRESNPQSVSGLNLKTCMMYLPGPPVFLN